MLDIKFGWRRSRKCEVYMVFGLPPGPLGPLGKGAHQFNNFDGPSGTYARYQIWFELVQQFLRKSKKCEL